ncbi:MAG: glycosyltransferase [Verrucomicrobiota bacterium]|nr:glycosyltransferase [Verrucomicrobiota bacterium]
MKVLLIQDYLRVGGTERQTLFLARYLKERGHEPHLLTFRPGGAHWEQALSLEVPMHTLQKRDTRIALYAPGLRATVATVAPEIIVCMGRTANCYAGFIQQWFPNTVVVSTLRTGKMLFPLHWWSLHKVKAVLVNSSWWKRRLLKQGFPGARIHVVRNSLLLDAHDDHTTLRKRLREDVHEAADTCVFLNIATFRPGKRHADLLRIFRDFAKEAPAAKWRLWLVGEGKEWQRCQKLAREYGLADRVKFWGYQKNPYAQYCAADVAVSASLEDSLPNFLIEAQAMALPIVAWDYRGVRECCKPGETGYIFQPGDEAAYRHSLVQLCEDRALRARMAAPATAFARERFCPQTQAEWTVRFMQKLLEGKLEGK